MSLHEGICEVAGRLDVVVVSLCPELSRSRAARLIKDGAVQVDGAQVTRPAQGVEVGAHVRVDVPPPAPDLAQPQDLPLSIVHEDDDVVVVDKAAGVVVHPAAGHEDGTLVNALLHHVGGLSGIGGVQRPGIVHRLDRGTSGLIVVAKHDRAHRHLAEQFAEHTAGRTYLALTMGRPPAERGTIRSHLARHPRDRVRWASTDGRHGKDAVTHWEVVGQGRDLTMVQCRLETGRTHQIRVHLTENGMPLLGDPLYTRRVGKVPAWLAPLIVPERPMLHAWQLAFTHPTHGTSCRFVAPVPADMAAVLDAAGLAVPAT